MLLNYTDVPLGYEIKVRIVGFIGYSKNAINLIKVNKKHLNQEKHISGVFFQSIFLELTFICQ